jgi:hypothetical protein
LLRAGVELAEAGGWPHLELRARGNLGTSVSGTSPKEALETYQGALDIARRIGDRMTFQFTAALRADMLIALGEREGWDEADRLLDEAEPLASPGVDRAYILNLQTMLASVRGRDVADLFARLDAEVRTTTDPRGQMLPHVSRAWSSWMESRWTDAVTHARLAWRVDSWVVFNVGGIMANAAFRTGDRAIVEEMIAIAQDHPETSAWSNAVRRQLAAIAAAMDGHGDEALDLLSDALDRWAQIDVRGEWGICALNALLVAPDEPRTRAWAEEARARFIALDALPLVRMLDDAMAGTAPGAGVRAERVDETPAVSA